MSEITVRDLLAAPRGRRLCLAFAEVACREANEFSEVPGVQQWRIDALYLARYLLDPGSGTSTVILLTGEGDSIQSSVNRSQATLTAVREVADAIADISLPVASPALLLEALIMTVDEANYWQQPGGMQVLAARPELRDTLARVARHILKSPAAAWWTRPMTAAEQWCCDFGEDGATTQKRNTAVILADWARDIELLEERARRERSADPSAGWSGEWWSKPPHGLLDSTSACEESGPTRLHLKEDSHGPESAVVARVGWPAAARVFEIREPGDWAQLCRLGSVSVNQEKRHDWYRTTGEHREWVVPDWRRVAEQFDAIHLSIAGYLTSSGRAIDCGPENEVTRWASVIAGWDPDVTYWLNDIARPMDESVSWQRIEPDTHINTAAWRPVF